MSVVVKESELEDTMSNTVYPSFVAQHEGNRENQDTELAQDDYEEDQYYEELYEEKYWEHCEFDKNVNGFKRKTVSEFKETDDNFITYRKTNSRDRKEGQTNKGYKLDKDTTLIIEKVIDARNLSPYHDAIGEGRNSIVIAAGQSDPKKTSPYAVKSSDSPFKYAIKIYKMSSNAEKNRYILKRVQREYHNINTIKTVDCCKNVIFMELVGSDEEPALPLTMVSPEVCDKMYYGLIGTMSYSYSRLGGRIHGNLNCRNIFYCKNYPHIIGWGHSVRKGHPDDLKKLMKDCCFVTRVSTLHIMLVL